MATILRRPAWHLPERLVTPEPAFLNRRHFLRQLGLSSAAFAALPVLGQNSSPSQGQAAAALSATGSGLLYPAARSSEFNPKWPLTDERVAATYNNFYEFTTVKNRVHRMVDKFIIAPWPVEITGLIEKPMTVDVQELASQFPLEERVYRFRCVEAWAMIVPWTGFPLAKLIEKVQPKPEAKFVRFVTFNRPDQAPGMAEPGYPWPYTEGLRMDEAMNPLTLFTTGIYGKPLPKQHGAPVRIIIPWKYGYKSIKSVVKIEFVAKQPSTLWESLAPHEYPFESNVNPAVDHPRWSQATERMIDTGDRVKTKPFNGYGDLVAKLYSKT
jgi:sulfoxide reductase catalytic subunit YedY